MVLDLVIGVQVVQCFVVLLLRKLKTQMASILVTVDEL
jgi:hypothetical protein